MNAALRNDLRPAPDHAPASFDRARSRRRAAHHGGQTATPGMTARWRIPWTNGGKRGPAARTPLAKAASGMLAASLAASLACAGCPAFAATGSTQVTLTADPEQISVTVPASLPVAVQADGTFIVPDMKIENNSVFDVHVSSIKATPSEGFSVVDQSAFESAEAENSLWMSLSSGGGQTIDLGSCTSLAGATESEKWAIDRATDGQAGTLSISGDGAIKDFTRADGTAQNALSVTFTVTPGR